MTTTMPTIDRATIRKVARLARIRTSEAEEETLANELSKIIAMVSELNDVDTTGIEPLTSVIDMDLPRRADEVSDGNRQDDILANAPEATAGFFVVPKVVE